MKDLNDYKAEIFRRSEERIKERKKNRNQALAFCIPLCLVFAAVAFAKLPDISASDISTDNVSSSSESMFVQVEVRNSENKLQSSLVNTDGKDVSDIYFWVQSAFEATVQEDNATDDFRYTQTSETSNKVVQDSLSLFSESEYEIIFTSKDGETFSYTLDGNKLINNITKESVSLSSNQCFELQSQLGLIITWEEGK